MVSFMVGIDTARALVHQLAWGALLGAQVFESFVVVKLAYKHLPYRQFVELQRIMFPVYFRMQTALSVLTLATVPLDRLLSFETKHLWLGTVPLLVTVLCSVLNYVKYEPETSRLMMQKAGLAPKDDDEKESKDGSKTKPLAKRFSFSHNMSVHVNAMALVLTAVNGLSFVL